MYDSGEALVLAWDGKPVREGCDRVDWLQPTSKDSAATPDKPDPWWKVRGTWVVVSCILEDTCGAGALQNLRSECSHLGKVILLDADGKEIP